MFILFKRISIAAHSKSLRLTFIRLAETFLTCAIPSFISIYILARHPIINLMYALYLVGMVLCLGVNSFFWFQFMMVLQDWKKFLKVNLGTYLFFAAVMTVSFFITTDPKVYTRFFGIYRFLEYFDVKTIISISVMNAVSIAIMMFMGHLGIKFSDKHHRKRHHDVC